LTLTEAVTEVSCLMPGFFCMSNITVAFSTPCIDRMTAASSFCLAIFIISSECCRLLNGPMSLTAFVR
jgi:hypothetical protein